MEEEKIVDQDELFNIRINSILKKTEDLSLDRPMKILDQVAEFPAAGKATMKISIRESDDVQHLEDKDHNTNSERDYDDHISNMKQKSHQKKNLTSLIEELTEKFKR